MSSETVFLAWVSTGPCGKCVPVIEEVSIIDLDGETLYRTPTGTRSKFVFEREFQSRTLAQLWCATEIMAIADRFRQIAMGLLAEAEEGTPCVPTT